jgi:hypothetical protein
LQLDLQPQQQSFAVTTQNFHAILCDLSCDDHTRVLPRPDQCFVLNHGRCELSEPPYVIL